MAEKAPPRKKKASSSTEGGEEAGAQMKMPARENGAMKDAVLAFALADAPFDGFTDAVLAKAGKSADVSEAELKRLFPEGALSLVEYYSLWADGEMEKRLAAMDLGKMKIRENASPRRCWRGCRF